MKLQILMSWHGKEWDSRMLTPHVLFVHPRELVFLLENILQLYELLNISVEMGKENLLESPIFINYLSRKQLLQKSLEMMQDIEPVMWENGISEKNLTTLSIMVLTLTSLVVIGAHHLGAIFHLFTWNI